LVVPPKPSAPPHATLASAKPGQPKLSIGQSHAAHAATTKAVAPQVAALEQKLKQARAGGPSSAKKWVTIGAVVVICGVGGFLGYGPVKAWLAKRGEAAEQTSNTPTQQVAAAASPEPVAPEPPKESPALPPAWTLDLGKEKTPTGRVNGSISGTNFVAETTMCTAEVLRLFQGKSVSPDREILVYLHLNPGESPTGHTWTVSQEMKGRSVPTIMKRWKTNPRYAPVSKSFSTGYAMKLELGQITNGLLPGKIFVALPDTEQTVVAGVFQATTTLADPNGATQETPVATPTPVTMPPGANPAFDRRYRGKR
jgi:hypothetical protein